MTFTSLNVTQGLMGSAYSSYNAFSGADLLAAFVGMAAIATIILAVVYAPRYVKILLRGYAGLLGLWIILKIAVPVGGVGLGILIVLGSWIMASWVWIGLSLVAAWLMGLGIEFVLELEIFREWKGLHKE